MLIVKVGYVPITEERQPYSFGLIGNDGSRLAEERAAGVETKLVELSWRRWYPAEGQRDAAYS